MNKFRELMNPSNFGKNETKKTKVIKFYKTYGKDKNGKKIFKGYITTKDELIQNYYLAGVSCFIIDKNGNILVEKRSNNTKITSGELDLCSGHIDNDETPTQAMIREYGEELHKGSQEEEQKAINEAIEGLVKLDELDLIFYNKGKQRKFFIQFYALKTKMEEITIDPEEVDEILKIPMERLFTLMREGKTKFPYDERFEKLFDKVREIYIEKESGIEKIN